MGNRSVIKHPLFPVIGKHLQEIAKKRNVSIILVIEEFKQDLQNLNNSNYQKKIEEINIKEISEKAMRGLVLYLDELAESHKQIEKITKKREKQKSNMEKTKKANAEKMSEVQKIIDEIMATQKSSKLEAIKIVLEDIKNDTYSVELTRKEKRYIIKRLEEMETEEIKKQEEQAKKAKKENQNKNTEVSAGSLRDKKVQDKQDEVSRIWKQISGIVKKEIVNGNKSEPEYWIAIRKSFFGEDGESMQRYITMSEEIRQQVMQLLNDEIYYQEVKYYTHDFAFLRDLPEVGLGSTPRRRFHDTKSLLRYDTELRVQLEESSQEEYRTIKRLLNSDTDDVTRRILEARKIAIEKQIERRKREGREI